MAWEENWTKFGEEKNNVKRILDTETENSIESKETLQFFTRNSFVQFGIPIYNIISEQPNSIQWRRTESIVMDHRTNSAIRFVCVLTFSVLWEDNVPRISCLKPFMNHDVREIVKLSVKCIEFVHYVKRLLVWHRFLPVLAADSKYKYP